MKTWVRKTLSVGVLAAGALLFAPGAANADVRQNTGDNNGILNGNQIAVPVSVPVNVVGNSLGILGEANATGVGVNRTEHGWRDVQNTGDNNGILNGNQFYLPISVPVNVVGNAAALAGEANAAGVGVNHTRGRRAESAHTTEGGWPGGIQNTGDNNGILNGNQIYAPIDIPINVCGNSLALLGGANAQAICANNVWAHRRGHGWRGHWKKESGHVTEHSWQNTGDNNGILNGNQLYAPVRLPVNLAGNAVGILGEGNARAVAVNESGHGDGFVQNTGDNNGILNGNQVAVPISVPINICGNSLGILGAANSAAACANNSGFAGGDDWGWDGPSCGHSHPTCGNGHGWPGHGHGDGHGHGHGDGHGQNAGDNGDDDGGDYLGDNGSQGGDHGGYGHDQGAGNDDNGYGQGHQAGDKGYGKPGADDYGDDDRSLTEASPVSGLTETVDGVSGDSGLGGLSLLDTLR